MRIQGILFDKDGTLVDYDATWMPINHEVAHFAAGGDAALAERLLVAAGIDPATGRARPGTPIAAGTSVEIAEAFARVLGSDPHDALAAEVDRMFASGGLASVLIPGTAEALASLRAQAGHLGIATSDSEAGIEASLAPHGLLPLFDFLAGYDSGYGTKPGPGMVHGFCAATGLVPAEVCVIGDSTHDLAMASAAGAGLRVGVLSGTSTRSDLEADADLIVDSVLALLSDRTFLQRLA